MHLNFSAQLDGMAGMVGMAGIAEMAGASFHVFFHEPAGQPGPVQIVEEFPA